MKYEKPEMELIELVPREVFVTTSPGGGTIIPGTGGGGGFEDDNGEGDF